MRSNVSERSRKAKTEQFIIYITHLRMTGRINEKIAASCIQLAKQGRHVNPITTPNHPLL